MPPGVAASAVRAGTTITAKLATALVASSKIYYEDPRGALSNSGPHPPKVGEETTYIITWSVEAGTSALKNVEMVATVQPGVTVTDTLISSNEKKPTYNSANGQLRWVIETIPAGRAESTSVKVSITPAANQVGREVPLLGGTTVKAKDGFAADYDGQFKVIDVLKIQQEDICQ